MLDMRKYLALAVIPLLASCGGAKVESKADPSPTVKPAHSVAEIADWAVAVSAASAGNGGVADWPSMEKLSARICADNGADADAWATSVATFVDEGTKRPEAYVDPKVTMDEFLAIATYSCPEQLPVVRKAIAQVKSVL